ncbi:MAG: hypothetical protein ABI383_14315 [Acidobacteriaceae bacterium]
MRRWSDRILIAGRSASLDEFEEYAVSLLHDQESWLAAHAPRSTRKLEVGYAAARRNDLLQLLTISL